MFGSLGTGEIILIFLVVLLVFGAKRIPEIAQGLGKGIREFKKAASDIQNDINTNRPVDEKNGKNSDDKSSKN